MVRVTDVVKSVDDPSHPIQLANFSIAEFALRRDKPLYRDPEHVVTEGTKVFGIMYDQHQTFFSFCYLSREEAQTAYDNLLCPSFTSEHYRANFQPGSDHCLPTSLGDVRSQSLAASAASTPSPVNASEDKPDPFPASELTHDSPTHVLDMVRARVVEFTVTKEGKVWLNVDGVCVVRIQKASVVGVDDFERGKWGVCGKD